MSNEQHGFMKKKSCIINLLKTFESWTEALDNGLGLDVIYLDYQKAFDTVPHIRLITKLKWYSFDDGLVSWIEEFLKHRKMGSLYMEHIQTTLKF